MLAAIKPRLTEDDDLLCSIVVCIGVFLLLLRRPMLVSLAILGSPFHGRKRSDRSSNFFLLSLGRIFSLLHVQQPLHQKPMLSVMKTTSPNALNNAL